MIVGRNQLILLIAQGFGLGRIPLAPGTFGTVLGIPWTALLLLTGSPWLFSLGTIAGFGFAVWICGEAEELLGKKDPGSIVLDEIVALPLAYAGWLWFTLRSTGEWPNAGRLLDGAHWLVTPGVFLAFRFFDVLKPWPIRPTQGLWGGLGVVADDVLAAAWVAIMWGIVAAIVAI